MTLLASLPKAGKTTLISYLLREMAEGGNLGTPIKPGRALVVSEENERLWAMRRDDLHLADNVEVMSRPFLGRSDWAQWSMFADAVAAMVHDRGYSLVILDSIGSFWPCENENDAPVVTEALARLHPILDAGASLLLIHHLRKSPGSEGTASRGSGALTAGVDVILELRRFAAGSHSDRRRTLSKLSRFDEDSEVVLELTDGGDYIAHGTKGDMRKSDRIKLVLDIIGGSEDGLGVEGIVDSWDDESKPPSRRTIYATLKSLLNDGRIERVGVKGSKTDPNRYRSVVQPSLLDGCAKQL
jgi:hypothetical protein